MLTQMWREFRKGSCCRGTPLALAMRWFSEWSAKRGEYGTCETSGERHSSEGGRVEGGRTMKKLVLLRHGESIWNKENRFTGWTDVGLSEKGVQEAIQSGRTLFKEGYVFDIAYTSVLKRAIKTLWHVLEEMDLMWIPVHHSWRLNERHYGALQGLNKAETAERHGMEQVKIWRRSYDVPPPALTPDDSRYSGNDPRYADLRPEEIPVTECLK